MECQQHPQDGTAVPQPAPDKWDPSKNHSKISSLFKRRQRRCMTYEEFRAQEPPQARLLRLRGLFDLLVDHDSASALAGGRAKQMWRVRASRARYGAGGPLATGSLVERDEPVPSDAKSSSIREIFSHARQTAYAPELLAKCRARHAEMAKQFEENQLCSDDTSHWSTWRCLVSMVKEDHNLVPRELSWLWNHVVGVSERSPMMLFESGWTGSRVWGLRATEDTSQHAKAGEPLQNDEQDMQRVRQRQIEWEGFVAYAELQERELYNLFYDMDTEHDGVLSDDEIRAAFDKAGIRINDTILDDFIASLASGGVQDVKELHGNDLYVTFPEFRDYLLLLPRRPTLSEIYHFYKVRKVVGLFGSEGIFAELGANFGKTARGVTSVNFDGDVSLAGDLTEPSEGNAHAVTSTTPSSEEQHTHSQNVTSSRRSTSDVIQLDVAFKFLLAGGVAGAVSRTATAPFDRLKIYLITSQSARNLNTPFPAAQQTRSTFGALSQSLAMIYREGGLRGFWLGNGLNCMKIIPESAIKFFTYEYMKRFFAKYVDGVSDSRDVSGMSRFISGGVGGITSQLSIYPIETLKTRLMSSMSNPGHIRGMKLLFATAREMSTHGGIRSYYRGLGAGLVGVFPYSAIDMSTFEGIKLFYLRYTGKDEPGVLALLAFGSISGSIGAATVYPLNLVRTRLQASGTPAHPTMYVFFSDEAYTRTATRVSSMRHTRRSRMKVSWAFTVVWDLHWPRLYQPCP